MAFITSQSANAANIFSSLGNVVQGIGQVIQGKQEKAAGDYNPMKYLSLIFLLFFATPSYAYDTYYIRTDGGTSTQCTGKADVAYDGSGTGEACAFKNLFYATGWNGGAAAKIVGGDTVVIGDSVESQGSFPIGYSSYLSGCSAVYGTDCRMSNLPSGPDASHPTRIVGKGWDTGCTTKPELWGRNKVYWMLRWSGRDNIDIECLKITDHDQCTGYNPYHNQCGSVSTGNYGWRGIDARNSANVTIKNVDVIGMPQQGFLVGKLTDWTIENVNLVGNGAAGWDNDHPDSTDDDNAGTMTFKNVAVKYNGCGYTYPGEIPVDCFSQDQGGYGDGLGTSLQTKANWVFENCDFSHNVSDGLDMLYFGGNKLVSIIRSRFEGNCGNQIKSAASLNMENSIVGGNCDYFSGKSFTLNDAAQAGRDVSGCDYDGVCDANENSSSQSTGGCRCLFNTRLNKLDCGHATVDEYGFGPSGDCVIFNVCRAGGDAIAFAINRAGDAGNYAKLSNNTIYGNGNYLFYASGNYCNGTETITSRNNIFYGNTIAGGGKTGLYGEEGTCYTTFNFNNDYSIVYNVQSSPCPSGNLICLDPHFTTPIDKTLEDMNFYLSTDSPAIDAADETVTLWNGSNDKNDFARGASWDIGGFEGGSYPGSDTCATSCLACLTEGECIAGGGLTCYYWSDGICRDTEEPPPPDDCDDYCSLCTSETCLGSAQTCYLWDDNTCHDSEQPVIPTICENDCSKCNDEATQEEDRVACINSVAPCWWHTLNLKTPVCRSYPEVKFTLKAGTYYGLN